MTEELKQADESVLIFHTGKGHGPMHTAAGILNAGQSLPVPQALADKLIRAYPHIKLAKDVIPVDPRSKEENLKLKAQVADLEKQLAEINLNGPKAIALADERAAAAEKRAGDAEAALAVATPENLQAALGGLQGVVRSFLKAGSKKDLEALQAKHKDAVPAE